jgi:hypothetical protein
MAIKITSLGGTDWENGEVLEAQDLIDTFDEGLNKVESSEPSNPYNGMIWYDDTEEILYIYDGSKWKQISDKVDYSDFEDGWNGWEGEGLDSITRSTDNPHSGNYSIKLQGTGSGKCAGIVKTLDVTDYDELTFVCQLTQRDSAGGTGFDVMNGDLPLDGSGGNLFNGGAQLTNPTSTNLPWRRITVSLRGLTGSQKIAIYWACCHTGTNDDYTAYIDDVKFIGYGNEKKGE